MDESVPPKPPPRRRKTAADLGADASAPAPVTPRRRAPAARTPPPAPETTEPAATPRAPARRPRAPTPPRATPSQIAQTTPAVRPSPPPAAPTRAPVQQQQPVQPAAPPPRPVPPPAQERPRVEPPRSEPRAAPAPEPRAASPETLPSFLRPTTPPPRTPAAARVDPRPADTSPRSRRVIDWLIGYLPPQYHARALNYLVLMRMDRPVGALLLLWPTWWALWFATNDFPSPGLLVIFTLGVFVMRSAGCVINDYADHEWLDAHVERTRGRPMAAGRVTRREALLLFGALLALAFVLVLFTNRLTIELSFVGAALAAVYPFTKRVTHLAQVVLGAAFGWSIPMAFAAVTNSLPPLCWLLFLANVLFSTIYDTEYAMVDRDDDIRVGAKSTAILFGDADRAIIGILMATFVFAMLLAGTRVALRWPYFVGVAVATGLLAWQQWMIRDRSRAHSFAAFRNNNWVGLALWVGLVLALAIR